jgi:hypothetical protein
MSSGEIGNKSTSNEANGFVLSKTTKPLPASCPGSRRRHLPPNGFVFSSRPRTTAAVSPTASRQYLPPKLGSFCKTHRFLRKYIPGPCLEWLTNALDPCASVARIFIPVDEWSASGGRAPLKAASFCLEAQFVPGTIRSSARPNWVRFVKRAASHENIFRGPRLERLTNGLDPCAVRGRHFHSRGRTGRFRRESTAHDCFFCKTRRFPQQKWLRFATAMSLGVASRLSWSWTRASHKQPLERTGPHTPVHTENILFDFFLAVSVFSQGAGV